MWESRKTFILLDTGSLRTLAQRYLAQCDVLWSSELESAASRTRTRSSRRNSWLLRLSLVGGRSSSCRCCLLLPPSQTLSASLQSTAGKLRFFSIETASSSRSNYRRRTSARGANVHASQDLRSETSGSCCSCVSHRHARVCHRGSGLRKEKGSHRRP